jgi:outer membrane protein OmpA-like peptidoglycan-associated protein
MNLRLEDYMSFGKPRAQRAMVLSLFAFLAVFLISNLAVAQSDSTPKFDVFAGYQWLHPGANVPVNTGDPAAPLSLKLPDMPKGAGGAFAYNFDRHWALEGDFGYNRDTPSSSSEWTAGVGPRFMVRTDTANFFLHSLVSFNRVGYDNGVAISSSNGIGAILGGGMDLPLTKSLAWRLFQVDYVWTRHNYADIVDPGVPDLRRASFEGVRLRTGIVYSWGGAPAIAPTAACSVQPTEVFVGEPINATVTGSNFNPKHTVLTYAWTGNGGTVTGKDTAATIDTTGAAPGNYTVTAHITDAKLKTNNEASCSANYTVKAIPPKNPPTMSISASPATVVPGNPVNLSASCTSPDGVQVSVANWTASGGNLSGTGTSATLDTNGAAPSTITVNATCTDSRGLTTQATTEVTVTTPPPPPVDAQLEARLALGHSVYFPTALPPVKNPNAGLLASQQQTLAALATDFAKYLEAKPDAHLILEGHADIRGTVAYNQALSERRVARVKSFLVEHGIPDTAVETRALGDQHNLTTEEVKAAVEQNPELTTEERARVLRNIRVIKLASNRRVDISLSTTGQVSKRQFPFNATDSLTLIGGREAEMKAKKPVRKRAAPAKK